MPAGRSAAEADKLLAVLDPLAAMAGRDDALLRGLLAEVDTEHAGLQRLLDDLAAVDDLPAEPAECDLPDVSVPETWQLLVDCADEADQRALFERLTAEGYSCRVLSL